MTEKSEHVWFTKKGQVVIPLRLRKQFEIEDGTKAVVQATPDGILIQPLTAALIRRGRGILKRAPGSRSLIDEWAEHKKQERVFEFGGCFRRGVVERAQGRSRHRRS